MGVLKYTFFSHVLGEQTNICAILPTYEVWRDKMDYRDYYKNYGKKKLLFIMHGGSDDSTLYLRRTRIEEYAYERDMVVIFPEVRNSFYSNMVHGKHYFDYISKELPEVVMNLFPVSRERKDHFVLGNSMGSHGSFKWALNRPDFFAAANLSGFSSIVDLFGDPNSRAYKEKDKPDSIISLDFGSLEELAGSIDDSKNWIDQAVRNQTKLPKLFAGIGTEDFTYKFGKDYIEYMKAKGIEAHYEEMPGGHEWKVWDEMIQRFLKWSVPRS